MCLVNSIGLLFVLQPHTFLQTPTVIIKCVSVYLMFSLGCRRSVALATLSLSRIRRGDERIEVL
jgi:hypothetical protein